MNYDKSIFRTRYGSKYIHVMYIELLLFVVSFILIFTGIPLLIYIAAFLITVILFFGLPLNFCYYIKAKKQSERQRQWISNNKLYLERNLYNGLTAGGFVYHKITVIFDSIFEINSSRRYLEILGDISIVEQFNGVNKEKKVKKYLIPRNFSNEEQILKLGGN